MKRSSSLPDHRKYSNGSEKSFPKITKNPWLTNSSSASDYKYKRGEKYLPQNYTIMNKDKLNNIENNYYEMRYFLNDKINRLEKNQKKFNNILKYSLEQNRLQNDINAFNYDKYIDHVERIKREKDIQYYKDKNYFEKEYLKNFLNEMPKIIDDKIERLLNNEYDLNNKKNFMDDLKEKMEREMQEQRMHDYIKYKKQINELKKLRSIEEQEKLRLQSEIEQQRIKYKLKSLQFNNRFSPFNPYAFFPFNPFALNSQMDEFMKAFLFKDMMGRYNLYNKYFTKELNNNYPYTDINRHYKRSMSDIFDDYMKYKQFIKNKDTFSSFNSKYLSDYDYDNDKYGSYIRKNSDYGKIPFINSGRAYPKIKTVSKKSQQRFMTSHNHTNKTNKSNEKSKTSKESKTKSVNDKSSKVNKSSKESKTSKSNKDKSETESGEESQSGCEKSSKEKSKEQDKDKKEDKKEENDKDKDKDKKDDKKKEEKEEEDEDEEEEEESDEESNEKNKKDNENKKEEN